MKKLDERLVDCLMHFARKRYGSDWLSHAVDQYLGESGRSVVDVESQLCYPWALFCAESLDEPESIASMALKHPGEARIGIALLPILSAQLEAWLGVWEVTHVDPGVGMHVSDLLTHEQRFVHEVSASRTLRPRDALLGRVVDSDGVSFLAGMFPVSLGPRDADMIAREVRRVCRVRTRPVALRHLQDPALQRELIGLWRAVVNRPVIPPTLTNTDGDPVVMTVDRFDLLTSRAEVLAHRRLGAAPIGEQRLRA